MITHTDQEGPSGSAHIPSGNLTLDTSADRVLNIDMNIKQRLSHLTTYLLFGSMFAPGIIIVSLIVWSVAR